MKKIFILDTNVLIHDPESIFAFEDNHVYLPIFVIEEIDKLKKNTDQVGKSARDASRIIDKLRLDGCLSKGIKINEDGEFKIIIEEYPDELPNNLSNSIIDNKILSVGLYFKSKKEKVVLVSKDTNVRIKADALGLVTVDYEKDLFDIEDMHSGNVSIELTDADFKLVKKTAALDYKLILKEEPFANQMIEFKSNNDMIIMIYKKERQKLEKAVFSDSEIWGIKGRNKEQQEAIQLLMDERIKLVSLVGKAGTGKTLLAIAAALEQAVERKLYKKILIARPIIPMGKDIGYLPGTQEEKMKPWMQPIYDNVEFLVENKENSSDTAEKVIVGLESLGILKIEPLTYIRGRSIPQGIIIIDEAQNLTPHEVKTIVTRAGKETKLIFTGDPYQIDNPYLNENSNGLSYLVEKLKNEPIAGSMTLVKGERSELAEIASKLL